MNHARLTLCLVCPVWALAALACNSNKESTPAASASDAAQPAASAPASAPTTATATDMPRRRERGPGHGGVDAVLFRAAADLPTSAELKAKLAAIEGKLHDRETGPRDTMKAFTSDLADQVNAGKIDASKLKPDETAFESAMKEMLDKQATALGALHDALDAGQRQALAGAVRARAAARAAQASARDAGASDWIARRLDRMTRDIGLDAGQQKQVGAILAKQPGAAAMSDDTNKQVDAVLAAFPADSFDAAKTLQATLKAPRDALDRQIALATQLLAVVHPDQREKLSRSVARPSSGWSSDEDDGHRGGGGGGGEGNGGGE